jgi:hypothetical protein
MRGFVGKKVRCFMKKPTIASLEEMANIAPYCGGTMSSAALQQCLAYRAKCSAKNRKRIDAVIEQWRSALHRHNSQLERFITYDLKTGLPTKRGSI